MPDNDTLFWPPMYIEQKLQNFFRFLKYFSPVFIRYQGLAG